MSREYSPVTIPYNTATLCQMALRELAKQVAEQYPGQLGISEMTILEEHMDILRVVVDESANAFRSDALAAARPL
jgi:hypothetical protein